MNFTPDADQALLRHSIRRFMKSEVTPLIAKHDVEKTFPFEILKGLAQFGYIGGRLPESEGGMGMDQSDSNHSRMGAGLPSNSAAWDDAGRGAFFKVLTCASSNSSSLFQCAQNLPGVAVVP